MHPNEETHRHAYNTAFHELGLPWHWDAATYAGLRAHAEGRADVHTYLQAEHPHLLRAYEPDFLVTAIETAKARCYESLTASRERPSLCNHLHGRTLSRMAA